MTNNTGKKNQERRKPYDFLDKKGTTATRQDYIETAYVNGVKNDKGEVVIRPMSPEEKEWLSQFIAETEHGNLNKTSQIKAEVKNLKVLRSKERAAKLAGNVPEMESLFKAIEKQLQLVENLRESCNNFYTSEEDVKEIYTRDNERRRDVYNNAKINEKLVLYDLNEYDKFSTEALHSVDPENLILDELIVPVRKRRY